VTTPTRFGDDAPTRAPGAAAAAGHPRGAGGGRV